MARLLWGTNNDRAHALLQADDGGIVLVGEMASADFLGIAQKGKTDAILIKVK